MAEILVINTTRPDDHDFNSDLTDTLEELGVQHSGISYVEAPEKVERINAAHRVIVAGVPFHYPAESAETLQPYLKPWLPDITVPVLGICLGHQAVGLAFNATMRREEEIEVGTVTAQVEDEHQDDPIFKGLGKNFEIACLHWASLSIKDAPELVRISRSLPKPHVSSGCENQVIRVAGKQIYGAQFHPEKCDAGKKLMRNFLELPKDY